MRKVVTGLMLALIAGALAGNEIVLVEHDTPAGTIACVGAESGGKCDLVWLNYSVETLQADRTKVNCPRTSGECYQSSDDARSTSSGWGTGASSDVVPGIVAGPLSVGLATSPTTSTNSVRIWTGIRAQGGGSGAVAVGAGRNAASDPFGCLTLYGADGTDGHVIAGGLASSGISDDATDYDTDAQFCGELLRGVV